MVPAVINYINKIHTTDITNGRNDDYKVHVYSITTTHAKLNKMACGLTFLGDNTLLVATGNVLCHYGNRSVFTRQSEVEFGTAHIIKSHQKI